MSFILPALSAVLQAASFTLDKITLRIRKVTYKTYTGISFPLIVIFTLIIFFAFKAPLSLDLFKGNLLIFLIISIVLSAISNLFFYRALKNDSLSEMETISLLSQITLVIFAGIFFMDERNPTLVGLGIVAVLAVIWSHWEKHHFHIAKKTWPYLLFVLAVSPFSGLISKQLLTTWNPISLQLIRDLALCLIFVPIYFRNIETVPLKAVPYLLTTNLLTTIAWILYFFSYQSFGIVYTVMIFSLQPLLVYFASLIFLKEKFHWKKLVAFAVILTAIIIAQIFKYGQFG